VTPRSVELNVAGWLAARRYGVPARTVAEATERRLAGDWRGACAAARFDPDVDLARVRSTYGAATAERVEDDLRHLAPDLARWHLPRHWRGGGVIEPAVRIPLAHYPLEAGASSDPSPSLWLMTAAHAERPQRVAVHIGPFPPGRDRVEDWSGARYLWDTRDAPSLLTRAGGGDRAPFFDRDGRPRPIPTASPSTVDPVALTEWVMLLQDAGRYEEAWAAAGVAADFAEPESDRAWRSRREHVEEKAASVPALLAYLRRCRSDAGTDPVSVTLRSTAGGWRPDVVTVTANGDTTSVRRVERDVADRIPVAPRPHWERLPDLELLRFGHLDPDHLHPLVRAALFPDRPASSEYEPVAATRGGTAIAAAGELSVPVRCRGEWHQVGWRDGRVEPRDHTAQEMQRERVMRSLGGEVPRCFTITETWRGAVSGALPRPLRELRHHALSVLIHGDTDGFVRLLDAGVDPAGIRDRWGRNPLHQLARIDGARVLDRLLAAGLDINGVDLKGRSPLGWVLFDGGSAPLVRALLDAGADPRQVDGMGETALHLLRSPDAATILPWLLAAGLELETHDEYGRTPLMTQVISWAPTSAIRAMVDAGADVTAVDEYTEQTIAEVAEYNDRYDLDFLPTASRADADD